MYDKLKYQAPFYERYSHSYIKIGTYSLPDDLNSLTIQKIENIDKFIKNCFITLFIHTIPNIKFSLITNDFRYKKLIEDQNLKEMGEFYNLLDDNVKLQKKYDNCPVCFEITSTRIKNCNHHLCVKCYYKMYDTQSIIKCPCCRNIVYNEEDEYSD